MTNCLGSSVLCMWNKCFNVSGLWRLALEPLLGGPGTGGTKPRGRKSSHTSYVQLLGGPETLHYTFCSIWMDSGRLPSPPRRMNVHHCLDRCLFLQATDGGMSLVLCLQEVSQAPHHFRSAQTCHPNSNPYSETDGD